jgi:hypothetical protein
VSREGRTLGLIAAELAREKAFPPTPDRRSIACMDKTPKTLIRDECARLRVSRAGQPWLIKLDAMENP